MTELTTVALAHRHVAMMPLLLLIVLCLQPVNGKASVKSAARIVSLYGDVWVSTAPGKAWRKISQPENLYIGSSIRTGRLSGVSLRSEDESLIRLSQNSEFSIDSVRISAFWRYPATLAADFTKATDSSYQLLTGKLWGRNNNRHQNIRISTSAATIGIRGTEYMIQADQKNSRVSVLEGNVSMRNKQGEVSVSTGEQGIIRQGQKPLKQPLKNTGKSLQWTVQVPELLDIRAFLKRGIDNKGVAARVYDEYQQKHYAQAAELLKPIIKKQPHNMRLWLVNAWLHLKGGESAGVYKSLKILAKYSPNDVKLNEVAAYGAFINGKMNEARVLLDRLQLKHQLTDTGWITRGYIAQKQNNLPAAMSAFQKAIALNPRNVTSMLLLARAYIGSNQSDRAGIWVDRVLQKHPKSGTALKLRGFIELSSHQSAAAVKDFEFDRDSGNGDSETWFGLSLAYMYENKVSEAMKSLATAVLLTPRRSLYSGYWGKMLYQLGCSRKELMLLDSAMRLDPKDPLKLSGNCNMPLKEENTVSTRVHGKSIENVNRREKKGIDSEVPAVKSRYKQSVR